MRRDVTVLLAAAEDALHALETPGDYTKEEFNNVIIDLDEAIRVTKARTVLTEEDERELDAMERKDLDAERRDAVDEMLEEKANAEFDAELDAEIRRLDYNTEG